MRIETVRIRRLKSKSTGYGHYAIEAEARVLDGEEPEDVRTALTDWIDSEIAKDEQCERMSYSLQQMMETVKRRERKLSLLDARIVDANSVISQHEKLRELADKAGLRIPGITKLGDDIPF